jgi:hypothetical protein
MHDSGDDSSYQALVIVPSLIILGMQATFNGIPNANMLNFTVKTPSWNLLDISHWGAS